MDNLLPPYAWKLLEIVGMGVALFGLTCAVGVIWGKVATITRRRRRQRSEEGVPHA